MKGKSSAKRLLFKGLSFDGCESCHTSPHRSAFEELKLEERCQACHNTVGWKNNRPGKNFDHNLTHFRLAGKHIDLSCNKCHVNGDFKKPIAHARCANCHEDPHGGQFQFRAAGSDCSACHSPMNFKPSLFDRAAHRKSAFALEGKHSTVPCSKCHEPEGKAARYRTGKLLCSSCHPDPHGGEFASETYDNECNQCHSQVEFRQTSFTVERHARTQFPLTGPHAEVACQGCHKTLPAAAKTAFEPAKALPAAASLSAAGGAQRRYRLTSFACDACHTDPHEIDPKADLSCETCHSAQQPNVALSFDHSHTGFQLEGAHLNAANPKGCVQCHKASGKAEAAGYPGIPVFAKTSAECSACHIDKDPHAGQFGGSGNRQEKCSACHTPLVWTAVNFDHAIVSFKLDGAHRKVSCAKCHTEVESEKGKMVRVYRDTPVECGGCH